MDETTDGPAGPAAPELLLPAPLDAAPGAPGDAQAPSRWLAFGQVVAVSGVPTQLLISGVLFAAGISPIEGGDLSLRFFALVGLLDTALVVLLLHVFLSASREPAGPIFLGTRPARREALLGVAFVPLAFLLVGGLVLGLRAWLPALRTVPESPLDAFLRTPADALLFLVVAVLAGGVREELQRAFILHRFEQRLGGIRVGLVVFSAFFGLFHLDQGADVAIGIGALGLAWGILYVRRRSAVMPMANHVGFNAVQIIQVMLTRSMGVG